MLSSTQDHPPSNHIPPRYIPQTACSFPPGQTYSVSPLSPMATISSALHSPVEASHFYTLSECGQRTQGVGLEVAANLVGVAVLGVASGGDLVGVGDGGAKFS